ncbi:MAG TPA: PQQ-binding-like beta-propeller repeat protein [Candidatus Dormibacteraeota bacterium]|jgi:outer membrane protein assembly factor BamB|nr:PQQ-binding-like beta-propeller repeat protein [Candidatus Dormibacteraeota bacterium]
MPLFSALQCKCALFILVTAATLAPVAYSQDAIFHANPTHTGVFNAPGVPEFHKVRWLFRTKGPVLSSPIVSGDSVYVGSTDHNFYALDLATGNVKWKFETGGRVQGSAVISNGSVFFESYDSNLYCLDAATGKLKWKFKTDGEHRFAAKHLHGGEPAAELMPDPFDFFLSSPVVANGLVYFGSGDGNVYALDAVTGYMKWRFKAGDVIHASPALADGTLYVGSWDSYFYALDAATGKEKWRFKTGEDPDIHNQQGIQSSAAVADGVVYFGCRDSKFYAVDAATGKQLWAFSNKGSWVISSPAIRDGKVYFATSDTGLFHTLDAKTGAPIFSIDFKHWPMFSSPAIAGDFAYIGSHDGRLLAISLKSQKLAWSFDTDGRKQNAATYTKEDGSPKYEAAFFDFFYDDMVSGVYKMFAIGSVLSSPYVAGSTVIFGATDGIVYALE